MSWAIERNIFIAAAHFLGILNVETDQESRNSELTAEWKLHESIFEYIKKCLDSTRQLIYLHLELMHNSFDCLLARRPKRWSDKCILRFMA